MSVAVFVLISLVFAFLASPQGVVSGNAPAAPRTKLSGLPFPVTFVDTARAAGITMNSVLGQPGRKRYIVEANGTGVAFTDYNNDGLLDIFVVNGSRFEPFPKTQQPTNHLYRNTGSGKFVDVTRESGVGRSGWGNGVCGGDIDNDGNEDLFVAYWGPNALYRNKGTGAFEEIAVRAGVAGPAGEWSTGCTFLDYDRDGHLDLLVSSYLDFRKKEVPQPGQFAYCIFKELPVFCGPRGLPHGKVTLYRSRGDGSFQDVSTKSGVRKPSEFYAFTPIAADLNQDGWVDLYVACDSTPSLYFRNNKDGTFTELATEASIAYNEHGAEQAGMGVSVTDYNNDGWLDITKTNFIRDYPNLYKNIGKGLFEDVAVSAGLAVNPHFVLWGTGFEDFDNDGWKDILQVGGHVYTEIQKIDSSESYANPRLIYRNLQNGKFEDVSDLAGPGIAEKHSSRGAAFGDFDNDGDIDVLIMNMDETPSLLRNDLDGKHRWIKLKLQGVTSNRSAIGSIVTVHAGGKTQTAPVLSQSSYLSLNDFKLHFGLGDAQTVEKIVVQWASGSIEEFPGTSSNALALLVEGTRQVKTVDLKR